MEGPEFQDWENLIDSFSYVKGMSYFDIVVQTKETVSFSWFIERFIFALDPVYLSGHTGTGKTLIISKTLQKLVREDSIQDVHMTFSS